MKTFNTMRRLLCLFALLALLTPRLFGQSIATFRPGDVFDMRLSGMPAEYAAEFALQFTVGQDGTVNVPLIGEIKALGLTSTQLERTMQNRFMGAKIFTTPTVIINQSQGARIVSVSGGVKVAQRLQWTPDMTLTTAIGNCQGFNDFARQTGIKLIRESKVFGVYNFKDVSSDPAKDPKLLPGDQVVVRE
jgi:protein involved in polysaccharide export with SLBB domain